MAARFFLVLCASALLVQTIAASGCGCGLGGAASRTGRISRADFAAANSRPGRRYGTGACSGSSIYTGPAIATAKGGSFGVSVNSPTSPTGVTLVSDNSIDGFLEVDGSLPVLSTVVVDGEVPSSGAAGTSYSCGSDVVGISTESLAEAGVDTTRAAEIAGVKAGLARSRFAKPSRFTRPSCGCRVY